MVDTAIELSKELRDPNGPHKVDLIIALTHCRLPNVSSSRMSMRERGAESGSRISIWRMSLERWRVQMSRRNMGWIF
jgi:hypothetical protein